MHATLHNDGLEHRFFYVLFYVEIFQHYFSPFRCQPPKMDKHTQTIRRQQPTNCLIVFDHFWGLALK